MADSWIHACFAFACSNAEMALLEEAFQASDDLMGRYPIGDPNPEFAAIFPTADHDDRWSGLRSIFSDPDYPTLGARLEGGNSADNPDVCTVVIAGATDFQPEPVAVLIQRCCTTTLMSTPIGFEWSTSCSGLKLGEFGGGWCAIFADRIEMMTTRQALLRALSSHAPPPVEEID